LMAVVALTAALLKSRKWSLSPPNSGLIAWIVMGCALFQGLFAMHSYNEEQNSEPFLGLLYGLAFGLLLEVLWKSRISVEDFRAQRTRRFVDVCFGCIVFGSAAYNGIRFSWQRTV